MTPAIWPRLPGEPALTRRSFAVLGAATLAAVSANAERPSTSASPTAAALLADCDLVQRACEALHPGLHRYNTPSQMRQHFDTLREEFVASASSGDWQARSYLALARLTAAVRCGHTYANFYNQSDAVRRSLFEGANRIPCEFRWLDGRMVVTRDLSVEQRLPLGTQIVGISGVPTRELLQRLMALTRADGSNDAKRIALLEVRGLERYETFDILLALTTAALSPAMSLDIVSADGLPRQVTVAPLSDEQRLAARRVAVDDARAGWRFERLDSKVTVLSMPDWALYRSRWDWKKFIGECFEKLTAAPPRALVLDLRGNEGGLDVGDEILPYLTAEPIEVASPPRLVRYRDVPSDLEPYLDTWDPSFRHWGPDARRVDDRFFSLKGDDGPGGRARILPRKPRFAGRVFVLIGPDNSSATFQFAERARASGLATLVGRTTGGNQRGINGGAFFFLRLPACGLEVDVPLIARFAPGNPPDAGLAPDVEVRTTFESLVDSEDLEMAAVHRLLA
ncbi:S41 family peptidase [Scleromatobacter humisilvae]|uniref:S41 family peptidase n=1 Tax=Scleromatobacter humisilvae TaxID=2897159 RepID=A0A9X1YQ60_9BURK|nr:S41 family peptidase [Scleromatobacter humisilvae]MCK9689380.1 S41 family peptidase [Scleromatobacter humisilvae]